MRPLREVCKELGISRQWAYHLIERHGIATELRRDGGRAVTYVDAEALALVLGVSQGGAWGRRARADKGRFRVPPDLYRLILGVKLAHPRASAARVLRIIELNDPSLLLWRGRRVSESTVRRILRAAERSPAFRYALEREDGQRELARTWHGQVLAEYANQMWMVDMTRCDVMVYIPEEDRAQRLRIHLAVDVFSGAVPGLVFSREEGQTPTNQLLILAISDKTSLVPGWEVWGKPERIYWDNGKVYRSALSEEIAARLGIELVYSRPRVSHTRGKIERMFGLFHQQFEALMPGYAGPDASRRDSQEIATLLANTRRWVARGARPEDDPYPRRLLLEEEYKRLALAWFLEDWHRQPVDGVSRLDLWRATVPQHLLVRYDLGDLYLLTAIKEKRIVRGNGTVQYRGRSYVLAGGSLIPWQGMPVWVLEVTVLPGQPLRVALENPDGTLSVLGELVPEPLRADSLEAQAQRILDRQAMRALAMEAEGLRQELAVDLASVLTRLSGLAPLPSRRERVQVAVPPAPAPPPLEAEDEGDDLTLDPIALGDEFLRRMGLLGDGEGGSA